MPDDSAAAQPVSPPEGQSPAGLTHKEIRSVIWGAMLALFLSALDQTIVATALPAISRDLGDIQLIGWVVTAYLLTSTSATPILGKLSDQLGRRRVVHICLALFLVGSVLCALAPTMLTLVLARALQGVGGGGLITMSQAIVADVVSPRERGRYSGIISGVWAAAAVLGPTLGGFLTQYLTWHWIFWINLPLGVFAFFIIDRQLRRLHLNRRKARIDYPGIGLFVLVTTAFLMALSWAGVPGRFWTVETMVAIGIFLVGGTILVFHQRVASEPILPPRFMTDRVVAPLLAAIFLIFGAYLACTVLMPTFLQVALGASPDQTGLLMIPMMISGTFSAWRAGAWASKTGRYKGPPMLSLPLSIASMIALGVFSTELTPYTAAILFMTMGLGLGPIFPMTMIAAQNAVQRQDLGTVSGSVGFSRSLGGAVATAAASALVLGLLARRLEGHLTSLDELTQRALTAMERIAVAETFSVLFYCTAGILALGLLLFARVEVRELRSDRPHPPRANPHE
jgi:EmrB/QacA subfamily drug resistance transporter